MKLRNLALLIILVSLMILSLMYFLKRPELQTYTPVESIFTTTPLMITKTSVVTPITTEVLTNITTSIPQTSERIKKKPFVWAWIYSTLSGDVKEILSRYGGSVIDIVSPDWYYLAEDLSVGSFKSRGAEDVDFINLAKSVNVSIIPMVVSSNATRVKNLITDYNAIRNFSQKLIEIAKRYGYAGFNIDFEVSLPVYSREFAEFINIVAEEFHREGLILTVDIPAKRTDYPSSYLRTYDYELLGRSKADYIMIMAYDYYEVTGPKPVAPLWWVEECIKYAMSYIPREKLVLGVPNYGKLWSLDGTLLKWLLYQDYNAMRSQGVVFSVDPSDEELRAKTSQGVAYYVDGEMAYYRAKLALSYNLPGVAVWRLDNGDPSIWEYFKRLEVELQSPPDYPLAKWVEANPSNYARADERDIKWIVIHVTEGSAASAIEWFKNPRSRVSAHYIVALNGTVYQMVREKDIAWHAGNKGYNYLSVGIEHEGFVNTKLFTDAQYKASARLVAYLIYKYNIPLYHPQGIAPANASEGSGIIGHDQVPDPNDPSRGGGASHHTDPGPNWDWNKYMDLVKIYLEMLKERGYEKIFKAVWWGVYSDKWSSDRDTWLMQADEALSRLSRAGVDAVFFLAKDPWGYVYYDSQYAPRSPKYSWDVLRDAINIAKKYGLRFYVYINVLSEGETEPNFYLKENQNLALYDEYGRMLGWVDPYCREYIDRVINIVRELLTRYPEIRGIQLDRIRTPQNNVYGKCSEKIFRENYNRDPREDPSLYQRFLADGITNIVREISSTARSIRPGITVSAAVFPSPQAVYSVLQDWPRWVNEYIVDFVTTMTYVTDLSTFKSYIESQLRAVNNPSRLYVGIGAWRLSDTDLISQISQVEELRIRGLFLFSMDSVFERNITDTLAKLRQVYYSR